MKILHLATFDTHGGAAVAAIRLVEGLRRRGHDASLLVREKATSHAFVHALTGRAGAPPVPRTDPAVAQVAWLLSQRARSAKSDSPFSSDLPTYDIADHAMVRRADVLHLHWVAGFLSAFEIGKLQQLGKPIVWTLHDQFPFTGGCHYAHGCRGFARSCRRCPQLLPAAQPLAGATLAEKRDFIDPARLVLAAPSRWIAACARDSALFRRARIEVIPYGIDVDARRHVTREAARAALEIQPEAIVLFASSLNNAETRKGHAHLVRALRAPALKRLLGKSGVAKRLVLLTAGDGAAAGQLEGVACRSLGPLAADDPRVAMAYRAADVFVLPSLEDNLPNTLLEAMAAGLPVVAYRTGGVPDVLEDGVNGCVVRHGDATALARALGSLLVDPDRRKRLGTAAIETARRVFDSPVQASAYERIYEKELGRRRRGARGAAKRPARGRRAADAPRLARLAAEPKIARLANALLRETVDELQRVIAARGGEIRDLWNRIRQMEANEQTLQGVIASRGGEIRDLRSDLARAERDRRALFARLLQARPAPGAGGAGKRVGIFGAGDGGRKVFEAVLAVDAAVAWFSDNDARLHGPTRGGIDVIAPDRIPASAFDVIVIGSSHRDAIRAQLIALGIAPARVVAPDVSRPDEEILEEIRRLLAHP